MADNSRDFDDSFNESRGPPENLLDMTVIDEVNDRTPPMTPHRVWQDISNMLQQHQEEIKSFTQQMMTRVDTEISALKSRFSNVDSLPPQVGAGDHVSMSHLDCSQPILGNNIDNTQNQEIEIGRSTHFINKQSVDTSRSDVRPSLVNNQYYTPSLMNTAVCPQQSVYNIPTTNSRQNQRSQSRVNFQNSNSGAKMKPQYYDGTEDLEDYLSQFEILADLNTWSYDTKSLYLASSLKGDARALLSELTSLERRDYDCLVKSLKLRFGSLNRSEIYKANLQTRVKRHDETISELAQSIKKLTRQAYPDAPYNLISTLARDHFIDALPEADMRLRLREAQARDIADAEILALRLEAYSVADRQTSNRKHVQYANQVDTNNSDDIENKSVQSIVDGIRHEFKGLANDIKQVIKSSQPEKEKQVFRHKEQNSRQPNFGNNQNGRPHNFSNNHNGRQPSGYQNQHNRPYNGQFNNGRNFQNRNQFQGNQNMSSTGASARHMGPGPQM